MRARWEFAGQSGALTILASQQPERLEKSQNSGRCRSGSPGSTLFHTCKTWPHDLQVRNSSLALKFSMIGLSCTPRSTRWN
jgi:hypothetical protein